MNTYVYHDVAAGTTEVRRVSLVQIAALHFTGLFDERGNYIGSEKEKE